MGEEWKWTNKIDKKMEDYKCKIYWKKEIMNSTIKLNSDNYECCGKRNKQGRKLKTERLYFF